MIKNIHFLSTSRAVLTLLFSTLLLVTTAQTARAADKTLNFLIKMETNFVGYKYKVQRITITREDDPRRTGSISVNDTQSWLEGTALGIDDRYDITITPNKNIPLDAYQHIITLSTEAVTFTVSIEAPGYYIKSVGIGSSSNPTDAGSATEHNRHSKRQSLDVSVAKGKAFDFLTVTLTPATNNHIEMNRNNKGTRFKLKIED